MNPHLRFGQGIPGITDGRGIGIIETRGLPELIDGVLLLKAGEVRLKPDATKAVWTTGDEIGLQAWMREYLLWLVESVHGKDESKNGNNHETWYDVQVASLALYTGQRRPGAPDAGGVARAYRAPHRAGWPSAARTGAHALMGLQHLQPEGVLSAGRPWGTCWRRPLESPHD